MWRSTNNGALNDELSVSTKESVEGLSMFNESRFKTELSQYRIECAKKMTGKVLDAGGGLGVYLPYFRSQDVTVLDISQEALDRLDWPDKVCCDACHTPFADGTFNSIWACSLVCYLPEPIESFLEECRRLLVKNGQSIVIIQLPNPNSPWNRIKRKLGMRGWEDDESPYFHMYDVDYLKRFGKVTGEVRFLPTWINRMIRNDPRLWHTVMLEIRM